MRLEGVVSAGEELMQVGLLSLLAFLLLSGVILGFLLWVVS